MWIEGKIDCNCAICQNQKEFELPDEVIEAAKNEELTIFCGSGISTESRNVLPNTFYENIYNFLKSEKHMEINRDISFDKLMSLFIKEVHNGPKELIKKIRGRIEYINKFPELRGTATRFHREVAQIPQIKNIITTNWDTYFEEECNASPVISNEDVAFWDTFERRVFKIHGSIENPGSVVASEEEYENCYNRLSNEPIGDRLKSILASGTVVFIGFSFGDKDLNRIISILNERLGKYSNQFYVVTLGAAWEEEKNSYLKPIFTDGTYFMHSLKNVLISENELMSPEVYSVAKLMLDKIMHEHIEVLSQDKYLGNALKTFPELFLIHSYQDGLIHAFQQCLNSIPSGVFLKPDYLKRHIQGYQKMIVEYLEYQNWRNVYYFLGYQSALISLLIYQEQEEVEFPPFYLYFNNQELSNFENID
ncbi:SIR2 family protein, partial [Alkalibacterium pelagium]